MFRGSFKPMFAKIYRVLEKDLVGEALSVIVKSSQTFVRSCTGHVEKWMTGQDLCLCSLNIPLQTPAGAAGAAVVPSPGPGGGRWWQEAAPVTDLMSLILHRSRDFSSTISCDQVSYCHAPSWPFKILFCTF